MVAAGGVAGGHLQGCVKHTSASVAIKMFRKDLMNKMWAGTGRISLPSFQGEEGRPDLLPEDGVFPHSQQPLLRQMQRP